MSQAPTTGQTAWSAAARPLPALTVILGLLALWIVACFVLRIPAYLVPPPLAVLKAAAAGADTLAGLTGRTVGSAALGLLCSALLAGGIGLAFTLRKSWAQASMPVLIAFRSAPIVAVAPIITLITGRGIATSVIVVTIVTFFPMLINFMRGLVAVDARTIELLHVYGGSRWQQLRLVRFPSSLPYLFTGLRVSGASALLGAMLSEWITGSRGLGHLILESSEMRETEMLWAAVIVSVMIALVVFALTAAAERRVLHWRA